MSVRVADRQESKMKAQRAALELASYTLTICKNEKQFPKRDRWLLTSEIVHEALNVYRHVRKGNKIRVETADDYKRRRRHQKQALEAVDCLLGLIALAAGVLPLENTRLERWTGLCLEDEKLIAGWQRSDAQTHGHLLK